MSFAEPGRRNDQHRQNDGHPGAESQLHWLSVQHQRNHGQQGHHKRVEYDDKNIVHERAVCADDDDDVHGDRRRNHQASIAADFAYFRRVLHLQKRLVEVQDVHHQRHHRVDDQAGVEEEKDVL